jgi:DNA ligase (NAD+)
MIAALNLRIGSRVVVTKRGEIIPKIEALVENPPDSVPIPQPTSCAACGSALVDEGTRLFCPNADCPKLIHHRLEKWISVLDVRDFGVNLIKRLFDSGRVRSIPDLYTLTVEELAALDRMGELSAAKVSRSLRAKGVVSLQAFVAGFDIEGIGETMVEKLVAAGFDTIEKLFAATEADFAGVFQFGEIMAHTLRLGLDALRPEMEALLASGAISIAPPTRGGPLAGLSFCFTGELVSMKRPAAEALVKSLGGSAKASVVKDLTFLVTNTPASGSSKNAKARELGVTIIDEAQFLALTDGTLSPQALLPEPGLVESEGVDAASTTKSGKGRPRGAKSGNKQMELEL